MKRLITVLLCVVSVYAYAQVNVRFNFGVDQISLQNEPSVDWTVTGGRSLGLKCTYAFKYFDLGLLANYGIFALNRPNYSYDVENSWFGINLSKGIKNKKKNFELRGDLYPYFRHFDTEFYSASLILDSHNFGLGMDLGVYWQATKKLTLGIGYSYKTDFYDAASRLDEVTNKDRFALLRTHSIGVNIGYSFNLKSKEQGKK